MIKKFEIGFRIFGIALLAFSCLISPASGAPVRISLSQALAKGLAENREIKAEESKIDQAIADIDRVYGEFSPRVEGVAGLGPITKTTGNAIHSVEDNKKWGAMFIGELQLTEPIYTWGRKSDYLRAAEHGKIVRLEDVRLKQSEIRYQIKESYFGTLYTMSLRDFIRDGKQDLERVEKEMGKKISKEDRFRLDIFHSEIDAKEAEVEKAFELAKSSLGIRTGSGFSDEVMPKEDWIEEADRELKPLEYYLDIARKEKPEYRQLEAGIVAKKSLASAEHKGQFPVLAILAKYDFSRTSVRDIQQSVFANDPYNHSNFMIGIGVKWDFQWGLQDAKSAKYSSEALELETKQAYANAGLPILIKKAWLELREADAKLKAARTSSKSAKKWLANATIGVGAGLGEVKKIIEAYQARALTLKDFYEAVFRHHMAWAQLSQVVGAEVDPQLL